jgi:hypothetical protein
MASIITFDGARPARFGDAWSDESASPVQLALGDAAWSFLSWGVVAFAAATAGIRMYDAARGFFDGRVTKVPNTKGARRR